MQCVLQPILILILVIFVQVIVVNGVLIPGCGDIEDMRWNSTCFISSLEYKKSAERKVLVINNLLMYDGIMYYVVPHRSEGAWKVNIQNELGKFTQYELQFKVTNVAKSPFIFGKASIDNPYQIKDIKDLDQAIIISSQNLKTHTFTQIYNRQHRYIPSAHVYSILCKVLKSCSINDYVRDRTMIINTISNQSILDYDNGVDLHCFSRLGRFPAGLSANYNSTLFMLRKVAIYIPNNTQKLKYVELQKDIQQNCIDQGFAYDPTGKNQQQKPYVVSVCAQIRNEGKYLLEWIAYHTLIGVDHFYLYDDYSSDSSMKVLAPLIKNNIVTVYPRQDYRHIEYRQNVQVSFFQFCSEELRNTSKWILSIDVDEFLIVRGDKYNNNLQVWLQDHPNLQTDTGAIEIPRESLSGNYYPINNSQLVTAQILYKKYPEPDFKVLANTNGLSLVFIHWAYTYKRIHTGNLEDWCRINDSNPNCTSSDSLIVYHYIIKDYKSCVRKSTHSRIAHDWRVYVGEQYCQDMIYGYKKQPELWSQDHYLANNIMTTNICNKMKELNQEWYDSSNACTSYHYAF